MSVYVDNGRYSFGRMIMCHMTADTSEELFAMAVKIGVYAGHVQKRGTPREHFNVCLSKRSLAVAMGAIEISERRTVEIMRAKGGGRL